MSDPVEPKSPKDKVHDIRGAAMQRLAQRAGRNVEGVHKALFYPAKPAGDLSAGWTAATSLDEEVGAIVLTAPAEPDELEFLLARPGRGVLPLVAAGLDACDFADARTATLSPGAIAEALAKIAPIVERVAALPRAAALSIRPETVLLARMYTRAGELAPVRDPKTRGFVSYPLAGRMMGVAEIANALVERGFLTRRFFDRFHVCPDCGSARLNIREECHKCRSPHLTEEGIVHHFSCAHEAPEGEFLRGRDLRCPKCSKILRHIGIDYDRPGSVQVCRACGHTDDTTAVGFMCIDCGRHHTVEAIAVKDWHSYTLTALGTQALFNTMETEAGTVAAAPPGGPAAFKVLLGQAVREAEHLEAPFTVLQVGFRAADRLKRADRRLWTETIKLAGDVVASAVRPVDAMLATEEGLLILMPRLKAEQAGPFCEQVAEGMRRVLRVDPGTEIAPLDPAAVHRLLREVR